MKDEGARAVRDRLEATELNVRVLVGIVGRGEEATLSVRNAVRVLRSSVFTLQAATVPERARTRTATRALGTANARRRRRVRRSRTCAPGSPDSRGLRRIETERAGDAPRYVHAGMEGTPSRRLPPGFRVGTVAARSLRHLVPPDGRFGICGAPVTAETLATSVGDQDRVCERCIERLTGRKPFVPQPSARKPEPPAPPPTPDPTPEPRKVAFELPRRIAKLLDGVLDPVGTRPTSRGDTAVRYELPVAEAHVVADVLRDIGERRESARILRAAESAADF
jgi:hypothetical protein